MKDLTEQLLRIARKRFPNPTQEEIARTYFMLASALRASIHMEIVEVPITDECTPNRADHFGVHSAREERELNQALGAGIIE